jgi:GT2 family glycosyltransferase
VIELSVVIPTWQTRELVLACLAALEPELLAGSGSVSTRSEVWVVDNGSRDGTAAAVRQRFGWVQLLELPENRGYAGGINAVLPRLRGTIWLLLNSDARIQPGSIGRVLAELAARPHVGIAGVQLVRPDGRLQRSVHAFPSLLGELLPRPLQAWLARGRGPSRRHPLSDPVEVDAVLGAALFVRARAAREVGPLCEAFFFFLEETDWCWRMSEAGWSVLHVPGARVTHLSGESSKRRLPSRTRIEYHRSLYRFLELHRGVGTARAVRALRLLRNLLLLPALGLLAPFSARFRRRLDERAALVLWHLQGRPEDGGLETGAALVELERGAHGAGEGGEGVA